MVSVIRTVWQRVRGAIVRRVMQLGRHDLAHSVIVTVSLLSLLVATPVAAQVGGANRTDPLSTGWRQYRAGDRPRVRIDLSIFIMKFLIRLMIGFNKAGRVDVSNKYFPLQIRDACYSLGTALLPALVPTALTIAGIMPVSCLLPGWVAHSRWSPPEYYTVPMR